MKNSIFHVQTELLLRILPLIHGEKDFALKGGTAINFFVRDLPRLSVDIDLVYLPVNERKIALEEIKTSLLRISEKILKLLPNSIIVQKKLHNSEYLKGLIVNQHGITVKIEPNLVIRGTVYPPQIKSLCKKCIELFETSMEIRTLSNADLYGGKICAALDRQHPRDIFDMYMFFKHEDFDSKVRKAFIIYLISHPRPMIELLNPGLKDFRSVYENEFKGMTTIDISYDELSETRNNLVSITKKSLTEEEKNSLFQLRRVIQDGRY